MSSQMECHWERGTVLCRLPGQQQALGWMVLPGAWEAGRAREASTPPACCSETAQGPSDPVISIVPAPESHWRVISHVIILETKILPTLLPALLPPSLLIRLLSPCYFFLSLHLPNKSNRVHIRMQRNQPQGHLLSRPGAALSLESCLSCSVTSSKKAGIFPSTFPQTRLFDFLSLDQCLFLKAHLGLREGI